MTIWEEILPFTKRLHGHVLNAGAGNGICTLFLDRLEIITQVSSIDITPIDTPHHGDRFVEVASGFAWVQGNVQDMSELYDDCAFDGIFCWDMFQNLCYPQLALSEFNRVLVGGGLLSIRTPVRSTCSFEGGQEETGTSGHTFTHWTLWEVPEMFTNVTNLGFSVAAGPYIDQHNSQNWVFRKERDLGRQKARDNPWRGRLHRVGAIPSPA